MSNILDISQDSSIEPRLNRKGLVTTAIPRYTKKDAELLFERGTAPTQFETFTPETIGDASRTLGGSFMDTAAQEFGQGLLGFSWYDNLSLQDREQLTVSASNYAQNHGIKAFFASMAGGMVSDSPTDLALALTGVGALSAINKIVAAGKASKGLIRAQKSLQKFEDAYTGRNKARTVTEKVGDSTVEKTVGMPLLERVGRRAVVDFSTGALAAAINDTIIRASSDRDVTANDTLRRMMLEGAGGLVFGEALRLAGKTPGALMKKINEDLPADKQLTDESLVKDIIDDANTAKGEAEVVDGDATPLRSEEELQPKQVTEDKGDGKFHLKQGFTGTVRDVFNDFMNKPEIANSPAMHVARSLFEHMENVSAKIPGRTQLDEIMNLPFGKFTDAQVRKQEDAGKFVLGEMFRGRQAFEIRDIISGKTKGKAHIRMREGLDLDVAADTLAHELTHAATAFEIEARVSEAAQILGRDRKELADMSNPEITRAWLDEINAPADDPLRQLNEVYASVLEQADTRGYKIPNIHEFVAEAFSNKEFQELLQTVDVDLGDGTPTSLWEIFVDAISQFFGVKDKTALSETIKATEGLIQSMADKGAVNKARRKGKATQAKASQYKKVSMENAAEAVQNEKDRLQELAQSDEGLKGGAGVSKDKPFLHWLRTNLNSIVSTDNLSIHTMFDLMGNIGRELKLKLMRGHEVAAKLYNDMTPHINKAEEFLHTHRDDLHETYETKLDVADKFNEKGEGSAGKEKKIKMTGLQKVDVFMKIMDGLRRGKNVDEGIYKNSASRDMYKKGSGFKLRDQDDPVVLTKAQVQAIQKDPLSFLSETELELAHMIWDGYRSMTKGANRVSQDLTGLDIMDPENWYYSPKRLDRDIQGEDGVDAYDVIKATFANDSKLMMPGNLKFRKQSGNFVHVIGDPMATVKSYRHTVSESLGNAELNIYLDHFLKQNKVDLKRLYGKAWIETLEKYGKAFAGDSKEIGQPKSPLLQRLLSLRAQAILGYNPTIAMKQVGSAFSATATGKLNRTSGAAMAKRATMLALPGSKKRGEIMEEAMKHSEMLKQRQDSGNINIDIADIADSLTTGGKVTHAMRKAVKKSGIGDLILDGAGAINKARLKSIGDTMSWIRRMDEATVAAIWEASKKQLFPEGGPKSPKDFEDVAKLFNEILLESQPTYNMGSRTFNQMRKGLMAKALTQFSTQTAKNYGLAYKGVLKFASSKRTKEDVGVMMNEVMPLLIQNAYIATVTTVGSMLTSYVREEFFDGDENRRTRMQKAFPGIWERMLVENINGVFGQIPGSGSFAKEAVSAMMGAPVYGQSIPVFAELSEIMVGIHDRKLDKIGKGLMTLSGAPVSVPRTLGF